MTLFVIVVHAHNEESLELHSGGLLCCWQILLNCCYNIHMSDLFRLACAVGANVQMALNVGETLCRKKNHIEGYPCGRIQQGVRRVDQSV